MKKYIALSCLLFGAIAANAQSAASFGRKVKTLPKAFEKPNENLNINESSGSSSLPWIVFSDRQDNFTTTTPGGSLIMKKLNFMEPFYVSKEDNGYLKLIKYKQGMVRGRKLNDKKNAISYGWIAKSKVLLWQSAFSNQSSGYPEKAIGIVSGKNPLTEARFYYDNTDSILVYNSPELDKRRTKIRLNEIVYIFKKSDDGKKYLVGSDDQLVADTALKSIYGWVSSDAVHAWGNRLYISAKQPTNYDLDDSTALALKTGFGPSSNYTIDPLLNADNIILRSVPVISDNRSNYTVGTALDVYNKKDNKILTINGGTLSFTDYLALRKNKHKVNVVFVVDGGAPMTKYFAGMTNTIQSLESAFQDFKYKDKVSYGAVVYRGNSGCSAAGIYKNAISSDYRKLMTFITNQAKNTESCNGAVVDQPVFQALNNAVSMFDDKKNQTNLLIMVGSTGNIGGTNPQEISQLSSRIANADARILTLQVYSDYAPSFNNYVIQARKLVSESAIKSADYRKGIMVKGEGLKVYQPYNTSLQDSISYYLDFPNNSLIQGGVVFPTKGTVNSNSSITIAVKRFVKQTNLDISSQISSLDSAFRLTGIARKNLSSQVEPLLIQPVAQDVADQMPHNGFKYFQSANLPIDVVKNNRNTLQYAIVLNGMEYRQITDIFSFMLGESLQQDQSSFRSKLVKNYVNLAKKSLKLKVSGGEVKAMTLGDYIKLVTGLPIQSEALNKYKVKDLKSESRMPLPEFEAYIKALRESVQQIKRATQIEQQFVSNGKTYYYITESNFNEPVVPEVQPTNTGR